MVRMKALQARYVAKEGVVCHQRIRLEHEANQLIQNKEAARILNFEVNEKKVELEATTRWCEELVKSNTNLTTELTTLHKQMEQVKANAVAQYQTFQPFYDELGGFYGDGFEDGLKQDATLYPNLDLS